jgi:cell division protein FtsQ
MNQSLNWKKLVIRICWILTASGIITFFITGKLSKNKKKCADINIEISGVDKHLFIDEKDIIELLTANGSVIGKPIHSLKLREMEEIVERNEWVKNAEIYFDNQQVLQINIEERQPIARIFQTNGNSFYLDTAAIILPLSNKVAARVPVFTSCSLQQTKDSILLTQIVNLAQFISLDSFLNAQIAQIDITPNNKFEIIPLIGNHVVRLGDASDFEKKLNRLSIFYKTAWIKYGINKYQILDVQYNNQVIGIKRGQWSQTQSPLIDSSGYRKTDALVSKPLTVHPNPIVAKVKTVSNNVKKVTATPKKVVGTSKNNVLPVKKVIPISTLPKQAKKPKTLMPKNNKTIKKPLRS